MLHRRQRNLRSVRDFARKEWPLRGSPADVRCHGSYGRRVADDFTERYGDLLTGSYDCVDRVVLNAWFPMGVNPGGCGPGGGGCTAAVTTSWITRT